MRRRGGRRGSRRRGVHARRRKSGAARAHGPHLPRHGRRRGAGRVRRGSRRGSSTSIALGEVRLPLTVEDAIQARIAALATPERNLLERAATMGSVFWVGGLLAIARLDSSAPDMWSRTARDRRDGDPRALKELQGARLRAHAPGQHVPGRRGVRLQAQPRARDAAQAPAQGRRRAASTRRSRTGSRSSSTCARTRSTWAMLARHREHAGLVVQAAATYLDAADLARERYANARRPSTT